MFKYGVQEYIKDYDLIDNLIVCSTLKQITNLKKARVKLKSDTTENYLQPQFLFESNKELRPHGFKA